MTARKVVLDVTHPQPQPSLTCPTCAAALSSVDRTTLQPLTAKLFRCGPGRHPRAFEGRCGCGRLLLLLKRDHALVLADRDQDALLASIRRAARDHAAPPGGRRPDR